MPFYLEWQLDRQTERCAIQDISYVSWIVKMTGFDFLSVFFRLHLRLNCFSTLWLFEEPRFAVIFSFRFLSENANTLCYLRNEKKNPNKIDIEIITV